MTRALERALKEASKLPEADQDALAESILAEIRSEQAWEEAFASSQGELERLADDAIAQHRAGHTRPLKPKSL